LSEHEDAKEVKDLIEKEGRRAVLVSGGLQNPDHCRTVIQRAVDEFDGIDLLVYNNAAHQATFKDIGDISHEEGELTFRVNIHAMFYLAKAAVTHIKVRQRAIVNTASVNSDMPNPTLLAYATSKGAIQNFTGGLAQMLAEKGIRVNAVAPGPIYPSFPQRCPRRLSRISENRVPMKRAGQPAELATAYVMLADPLSSYTSGQRPDGAPASMGAWGRTPPYAAWFAGESR